MTCLRPTLREAHIFKLWTDAIDVRLDSLSVILSPVEHSADAGCRVIELPVLDGHSSVWHHKACSYRMQRQACPSVLAVTPVHYLETIWRHLGLKTTRHQRHRLICQWPAHHDFLHAHKLARS